MDRNHQFFYNTREVAAFLRVHRATIYRLIKTGRIPAIRVGSDYRISSVCVKAIMETQGTVELPQEMSEPILIIVAGEAAPFQKKVGSWTAKDGRFGTVAYDTKKFSGWKDQARYTAAKVMRGRPPLACAVEFTLRVYFSIPESWSGRKKDFCLRGLIRPTVTPDVDNLCKASADAITGIVIRDDKFIVSATIAKFYSNRPRVEMEVREAELRDHQQLALG